MRVIAPNQSISASPPIGLRGQWVRNVWQPTSLESIACEPPLHRASGNLQKTRTLSERSKERRDHRSANLLCFNILPIKPLYARIYEPEPHPESRNINKTRILRDRRQKKYSAAIPRPVTSSSGPPNRSPSCTRARSSAASAPSGLRRESRASSRARLPSAAW